MGDEHELLENCKDFQKITHKFIYDMENQKDGIIRQIYCAIGKRLKMSTFLTCITGLFIISIFGIGFTYSQDEKNDAEHTKFATTENLDKRITEIEGHVQDVADAAEATETAVQDIKIQMVKDKADIINAINAK